MARWDDLFADLEAQADAADAVELAAEVSALQVSAWARTGWLDRVRSCLGGEVRLRLAGGAVVSGRVDGVGPDWLVLAGRDEVLVPSAAVVEIGGLGPRAAVEPSRVLGRLGLGHALRRLAERGEPVLVQRRGAPDLRALVARVGLDHVDLAVDDDQPGLARAVVTVPFAALVAVRPV